MKFHTLQQPDMPTPPLMIVVFICKRQLRDVYKRQEYENVAVLVAIAVNEAGFREVLGAAEGMKEDKASWISFFQWLRGRGLDGVKLIVGDKCMGCLLYTSRCV